MPTLVTLHVWNVPPRSSSDPYDIANRRVIDAFVSEHPEIRVKALVPLRLEGPAELGNELMAVAGGVAPDVFTLAGRSVGAYRAQGFLLPLDDRLAEYAEAHGKPYPGISAPDAVWELCYDGGHITCVPHSYYSMALSCRRDLFARAGYGSRTPRNWDELYEFARHLTYDPAKEPEPAEAGRRQQYGLTMLTGMWAGWQYLQYVWSAGGDVVQAYYPAPDGRLEPVPPPPIDYKAFHIAVSNSEAYEAKLEKTLNDLHARGLPTRYALADLRWRLITNSPAAMRALAFYRRLIHQPWMRNGDHEFDITPEMWRSGVAIDPMTGQKFDLSEAAVRQRIYRGVADAAALQAGQRRLDRSQIAMEIIWGIGERAQFDPKQEMVVPFPSFAGQPPASFIGGNYLAINSAIVTSDEPGRSDLAAIRRAAWTYIEFLTSAAAQRIRVQTYVAHEMEELIRPAALREAGYGDLVDRIPAERRKLWENLENDARVEPYCENFATVMTRDLTSPIEQVIDDPFDPAIAGYSLDLQSLMDAAVDRANTRVLSQLPPEQMQRYARIGWIIVGVVLAVVAAAGYAIVRSALRARSSLSLVGGVRAVTGSFAVAWLLLFPAVATVLIWNYYPLARGLAMAFQDYRLLGGATYIGLQNFIEVLTAQSFWQHLGQTLYFVALTLALGFAAPIVLAVLLTEIPRGKVTFRLIYYLPAVTTGLVTMFLWKELLFDPTPNGVLNRMILGLNALPVPVAAALKLMLVLGIAAVIGGLLAQAFRPANDARARWIGGVLAAACLAAIAARVLPAVLIRGVGAIPHMIFSPFDFQTQAFLRDPRLAMFWCVVPLVWAGAGPGCLIYLAALKGIPEEEYEAADLDGAGVWSKFWNVTFPNLYPLILITFIGAVIGGFQGASNIFVMTGGGPEDATMVIGLDIWYDAFLYLNFGRATAMAWILGALLIGFTLHQLRILNRMQFRTSATPPAPAPAPAAAPAGG